MRKYVRGDLLNPRAKAYVLLSYIYRNTVENQRVNAEAIAMAYRGPAPAPTRTDAEWLAAHAFAVRKDGCADARIRHAFPATFAESLP